MIRIFLLVVLLINSLACLSQSTSKEFLSYFLNDYLPAKNVQKINNKIDHSVFAKRYNTLIKRLESILKTDSCKEIRSNTKKYIEHLRSTEIRENYNEWFPPNQLFAVDSFYAADSIDATNVKEYIKAIQDSQKVVTIDKPVPIVTHQDTILSELRLKHHNSFLKAFNLIERSIEITVPYFFNDQTSCLLTYVRHMNYWPEAKVLLFEKSRENWTFKRVVFDQELYLDDENSPYLNRQQ
ncbi:MAG: hypothetical protein IM541_03260 [Chitinophagaceae bacterium]|nr:hypothetical protein [Chitinophagaceae bacterium]